MYGAMSLHSDCSSEPRDQRKGLVKYISTPSPRKCFPNFFQVIFPGSPSKISQCIFAKYDWWDHVQDWGEIDLNSGTHLTHLPSDVAFFLHISHIPVHMSQPSKVVLAEPVEYPRAITTIKCSPLYTLQRVPDARHLRDHLGPSSYLAMCS